MHTLTQFLPEPLSRALGWTLLHSLWQAALVALITALLLGLLQRRSATVRYFVALTALSTTFGMAVVTFAVLYRSAPAEASLTMVRTLPVVAASPVNRPTVATPPSTLTRLSGIYTSYFTQHLPLITTIWLMGITALLLRLLGGFAYLQRLRHHRVQPLSADWQRRMQRLSKQLGVHQSVTLAESALVKVPLALGYFKPLVLLPVGALAGLSGSQVEAILAHELAHIRRNDYLVNLLQSVVEILFFYHPAVWWLSGCAREAREHCCDDAALEVCGDSLTYAKALAGLEALSYQAPPLAMALTGKSGFLLSRIERFMQRPHRNPTFSEGVVAALVLVAGLGLVSVSAQTSLRTPMSVSSTIQPKTSPQNLISLKPLVALAPPEDTTRRHNEMTIIKNKKGKIIELYIDGQKIPADQIENYRAAIEDRTRNLPSPPAPTTVPAPSAPAAIPHPAPGAIVVAPGAVAVAPAPPSNAPFPGIEDNEALEREMERLSEEVERLSEKMEQASEALAQAEEKTSEPNEKIRQLEEQIQAYEHQLKRLDHKQEALSERQSQREEAERDQREETIHQSKKERSHHEEVRSHHERVRPGLVYRRPNEHVHVWTMTFNEKVQRAIVAALKKDKLTTDEKHYEFKIDRRGFFVNGKQQPETTYRKYKQLIEQTSGSPLQDSSSISVSIAED